MTEITRGDWIAPMGERAGVGGTRVVAIEGTRRLTIADCRTFDVPVHQQRANAALMAKAKGMLRALQRIEREVGDLPASNQYAAAIYRTVSDEMRALDLEGVEALEDEAEAS